MTAQKTPATPSAYHDRIAQVYLGLLGSPESQQRTRARVDWLVTQAQGQHVVDIGCSEGIVSILLGRQGRQVTGVDVRPGAVAYAQELLRQESPKVRERVTFLCADFNDHPFDGHRYDTAILGETLEHLSDPRALLTRVPELLVPGAQVIITTPFGYFPDPDHRQTFTIRSFLELCRPFFKPVSLDMVDGYLRFVGLNLTVTDEDWQPYLGENLLAFTEQAAMDEQKRYRGHLDYQINQVRQLRSEQKQTQARLEKTEAHASQLNADLAESQAEVEHAREQVELAQARMHLLKEQMRQAEHSGQRVQDEVKALREQLAFYTDQYNRYWNAYLDITHSVVYQMANQAKLAATHPGWNTLRLPLDLARLMVRGLRRVKQRRVLQPTPVSTPDPQEQWLAALRALRVRSTLTPIAAQADAQAFSWDPAVKSLKDLRVAAITDGFTHQSFAPECTLLQLTPEAWQSELESFQPQLCFIESAWQGKENRWYRQVDRLSPAVQAVINWCREHHVPIAFWNKEDPTHFDTFLRTAVQCDFIFTTDIDSVGRYKALTQSERVFLLPFAAQPAIHNPLERYERQDAVCFAGAYYARFPERVHDLSVLSDAVAALKPLAIYDRRSYPGNPDYTFPPRYQPYIVGSLPPDQIDRAYKGYRYGLNLNTIKQSKSMFARRVFELLASNTVVISNYALGVRNLFGDLVICSDDRDQLLRSIQPLDASQATYRKFRLAGLRRVLREDTYQDRLAYLVEKVFEQPPFQPLPPVAVTARAANVSQAGHILAAFQRQNYPYGSLILVAERAVLNEIRAAAPQGSALLTPPEAAQTALPQGYVACFSPFDYYGPNYLLDLALATRYSSVAGIGKLAAYLQDSQEMRLAEDGAQYRACPHLPKRRALCTTSQLPGESLAGWLADVEEGRFTPPGGCLAIDEFNYCQDAPGDTLAQVDDLPVADHGIPTRRLLSIAETRAPLLDQRMIIRGEFLEQLFPNLRHERLDVHSIEGLVSLSAQFEADQHEYVYSECYFPLQELDLSTQRSCLFQTAGNLNLQLAFYWLSEARQQLGTSLVRNNLPTELDVPSDSRWMRLALRVQGKGNGVVKSIHFLDPGGDQRASLLAKSSTLLLTNLYPAYDDLYRNAFIHRRVTAYRQEGHPVDVFTTGAGGLIASEFQGVDVFRGSPADLQAALASGQYTRLLVHFLDAEMWPVIREHLHQIETIVWVHGAEIQPWWRRVFNVNTPEEKSQAVLASTLRQEFWNGVFATARDALHFVFVSQYFANEVAEDYHLELDSLRYSIIHNFIDTEFFQYRPKPATQRTRILSVRPFASSKYANDLTVQAILALAKQPFFNELSFKLIGDGVLFDETVAPLRGFANVSLEKRFLPQYEIAALHQQYGVFLCPTRMDSQGVSRDEAMSSGLVPLSTRVTAIPEFVDDDCAILAPPEDSLALAEGIQRLYHDPDLFLRMSQAAARRVRAQSGFEQTIRRELALFTSTQH